jgi:hypothetical protein
MGRRENQMMNMKVKRFFLVFFLKSVIEIKQNIGSIMTSGTIYRYCKNLVYFESGKEDSCRCLIFIPGLTDGLGSIAYTSQLALTCLEQGLSLIQPIMSSSYLGYGVSSLSDDVEEIDFLIEQLIHQKQKSSIYIMGHRYF